MRFFVFFTQVRGLHRVLYDSIVYNFENNEVDENSDEVKEAFGWENSSPGTFRYDIFDHVLDEELDTQDGQMMTWTEKQVSRFWTLPGT